jgi:hypothetical protein
MNAKVAEARKEYNAAKREYRKAGKVAFGKPKNSTAKKTYLSAKRKYKKVGSLLGRLTGLKK